MPAPSNAYYHSYPIYTGKMPCCLQQTHPLGPSQSTLQSKQPSLLPAASSPLLHLQPQACSSLLGGPRPTPTPGTTRAFPSGPRRCTGQEGSRPRRLLAPAEPLMPERLLLHGPRCIPSSCRHYSPRMRLVTEELLMPERLLLCDPLRASQAAASTSLCERASVWF